MMRRTQSNKKSAGRGGVIECELSIRVRARQKCAAAHKQRCACVHATALI